jgi:alkylhydroperoxidase family enzyme
VEAIESTLQPAPEGLRERHHLAVALADALMTRPGDLEPALVAQLQRTFTPEQLIELTLKVMKFNIQKTMVALGTDDAIDPDAVAGLAWNPGGQFIPA